MSNRTEARSAKAARMHATGRLPLLRLFSTPLIHCHASQSPSHNRSRVVASYETGPEFASTRAGGRHESDRCRGSGAAVWWLCVPGGSTR